MSRKVYSVQFQDEACKLVTDEKLTVSAAAKKLGVDHWTLRKWLEKRGQYEPAPVIEPDYMASNDPKVLKGRIVELEKKLRRAETVNEILKKATAYFAGPNL